MKIIFTGTSNIATFLYNADIHHTNEKRISISLYFGSLDNDLPGLDHYQFQFNPTEVFNHPGSFIESLGNLNGEFGNDIRFIIAKNDNEFKYLNYEIFSPVYLKDWWRKMPNGMNLMKRVIKLGLI